MTRTSTYIEAMLLALGYPGWRNHKGLITDIQEHLD